MSATLAITIIGILLFSAALIVAIWQLVKYYRSRKCNHSTTSSLLESGRRRDSTLPQSPVHSGFQAAITPAKTHVRNRSEPFRRDPKDKPLPSDPENPSRLLEDKVERDYGWRWSWLGQQDHIPPSPIAKDDDPNYESIGLAR